MVYLAVITKNHTKTACDLPASVEASIEIVSQKVIQESDIRRQGFDTMSSSFYREILKKMILQEFGIRTINLRHMLTKMKLRQSCVAYHMTTRTPCLLKYNFGQNMYKMIFWIMLPWIIPKTVEYSGKDESGLKKFCEPTCFLMTREHSRPRTFWTISDSFNSKTYFFHSRTFINPFS